MNDEIEVNAGEATWGEGTSPRESRSWALRLVAVGLAVTVVGMLSYFLYFFQFPVLRDVPWINVPLSLLGVVLGGVGLGRVFRQKTPAWGKGLAAGCFALTLGFAGLFNWYVFSFSYHLPASSKAPVVGGIAPGFALANQRGETVNLSDFRGRKIVLVFYRGFW